MPKKFRLACRDCDTDECDGVNKIPSTWIEVDEIQTLAESRKEVSVNDAAKSVFAWYTHLGICPDCQKN